jgi:hypothetical protein
VDYASRPAQANILGGPNSRITRAKWTGGVVQVVLLLLCKDEAQSHQNKNQQKQAMQKSAKGKVGRREVKQGSNSEA